MSLFGFLGFKKKALTKERNEEDSNSKSAVRSDTVSSDNRAALPPYEYDKILFEKFYRDLDNNTLPEISDPTQAEIKEYTLKRYSRTSQLDVDEALLQENNSIPVEVAIWVEKVFDYYFSDLKPLMGLVHWCEGAKKKLYEYKGYTWHTIAELYPDVCFD